MAKFVEVFSNTAKVLFATAIIIGLSYAGFAWIHWLGSSSTVSAEVAQSKKIYDEESAKRNAAADARRTMVPASRWEKVVLAGIKQKCVVKGMSKQEVEKALGVPSEKSEWGTYGSAWKYTSYDKTQCVKYAGESCSEYKEDGTLVNFTPNGFATSDSYGHGCWEPPLSALNRF